MSEASVAVPAAYEPPRNAATTRGLRSQLVRNLATAASASFLGTFASYGRLGLHRPGPGGLRQGPMARRRTPWHPSSSWEGCRWLLRRGSCRFPVGPDRAVAAAGKAALPLSRTQAAARSAGIGRNLFRAPHRGRLAAPAARPGFRFRVDLLSRLDEWQRAGVWERLHALLLAELRAAGEIEWAGAVADSATCKRKKGRATGLSPVDRARNGSKHHFLVDATGIPLAWTLTSGNRNDVTQLVPLIERVPPVRGRVGRPRRRPKRVLADRGYDHDKYRRELRRRGIGAEIARRQTAHGSGLGRARWVVERTFAWLHHFKRLLVRYDCTTRSTKPSSPSPAASSASGDSSTHCDSSS